ncbi:DUF4286 family protein [Sulfobacillus harzensis]|uniref:EthD domain-containing protein n=1 Tax=Sulfobacillus harzensis TaxID=2729629 RepID=A0A7Y0L3R6_9FIRM|nr:DUF4286 family protein [Sulfobacillus harzensis]NMP22748.1 hypothetical protein [Sulfobacillus harzensis]
MGPEAVLFSEMEPQKEWEADFNEWYNTEHVPLRMALPGFSRANRYRSTTDERHYLAVYEMAGADVLASDAYRAIKENPSERTRWMLANVGGFTRYTYQHLGITTRPDQSRIWEAPYLYAVRFDVPPERAPEFDAWYERDHIPTLLQEPGWLGCRRYSIVDGTPKLMSHLALHYINDPDVLNSAARSIARRSPWRAELAKESWFKGEYHVYQRLEPVWEGK